MIKHTLLLLKLKFANFLGFNEAIRSGKKKSAVLISIAFAILGLVLCGYVVGISYLVASTGLGALVPAFLTILTSLIIFFFTVFKSGAEIFDYGYYCSVAHLPIKRSSIIASRLIGMYLTDAILSLLVFLSGAVGVSIVQTQSIGYYIMMILSAFLVPVLPLCVSCFIGVGVSAIVSRLKKGKLIGSILLCLFACGIMALTYTMPEEDDAIIGAIGDLIKSTCAIYPPALWISQGVLGESVLPYILFALSSVLLSVIFVIVVAKVYMKLCILLGSTHSQKVKIDIQKSKTNTPFLALYKREFKRLFSSTVYFTNTLIGNIMAIIGSVALLFIDASSLSVELEGVNFGSFFGPMVIGAISVFANMSPITTAIIGIEGKSFDLTKSLPVSAKTLLLAKLFAGFTFSVPTAIVVICLLIFSPICAGASIALMILSPLVFGIATPVAGLFMNIKFPSLKWTNEQVPVKQGKAVLFTMLFTFVIGLGYIALGIVVGELALYGLLLGVAIITCLLYNSIIKTDLTKIN